MDWGRNLKKALLKLLNNDLPTEFFEWREIAADRNQWRVVRGSKMPSATKRHRPPPDKTSGLSFDTALCPYKHKIYSKSPDEPSKRAKKERKYMQSDQPA
jgi:hypothetical protein